MGLTNRQAESIVAAVAQETGVAADIIVGTSRVRVHFRARCEAWRRMMAIGASLTDAGLATGHHHTTVMNGLGRRKA